ncbi:MAG TPA: MASE1 domain-containing protein [Candidatus Limnocylindrales bacterium]|nr:MASE1 domain-containing protein [Candidatus Limnocylindrales bacterium]
MGAKRELSSKWFFRISILTAVYYLAGKFGLSLAALNASASAVWPPTGIALASLLLWGSDTWPAVFFGAFLVNITTQGSFATSFGIATGNTLEAVLGAWLVWRFAGGANAFSKAQDTFKFTGLAAIVSTTPSATFGVTSLCLGGLASWNQYGSIWLTWWLGDMVSNVIIAPLVLIWKTQGLPRLTSKQIIEAALMLLTVIVTGSLLFLGKTASSAEHEPLGFLALPPLLWAAFRFGRRGAITAALIMSAIALWGTVHRFGPFVGSALNASLLFAQAFMGTSTLTALVLAALLSEQKKAEAILKESEVRFRAFFDNAAVGAVQLDAAGRIVQVNDAFCQITGYGRGELRGMHPSDLDHPDEKESDRTRMAEFLAGRTLNYDVEKRYVRKTGEVIWVHVTVGIIRDGNGQVARTASVVEDITARRKTEQALKRMRDELERANADLEHRVDERTAKLREMIAELEHFSYALVHDLRAPLRAMQSFAGLAEQTLGEQTPPAVLDYLQRIRAASGRMDGLVLDALNYNRAVLQDLPLEPVNLYELVSGIISTYPNLQPPTAQVHIEGSLPVVLGNKAGLTQCFSNLLGNAVKFVASGTQPKVTIRTEDRNGMPQGGKQTPSGSSNGALVRIWIEDNGIGITRESQGRIFDMFQRAHAGYEGTGTGLAIVRKVTERMAGQVGVESEPGKGSRFWLELRSASEGL